MKIHTRHLRSLLRHGYAIVPRFLTDKELARARVGMSRYFPSPEELDATPQRYAGLTSEIDFLQREFPFVDDTLCELAVHPDILDFVEQVLGTPDIMLARGALWSKYAGHGEYEQPLHCDYQGNTLVYPREDGDYRMVNIILYYTDVTAKLGPTYVVSQEHTREGSLWPPFRSREDYPELYEKEKRVLVNAGGMLIFGMQTFHRGSAMAAPQGVRWTEHLVYRAKRHQFSGYQAWPSFGEQVELSRFLTRATPRQRSGLGVPAPGDESWTPPTLKGVALRYPGMDLTPYRQALRPGR